MVARCPVLAKSEGRFVRNRREAPRPPWSARASAIRQRRPFPALPAPRPVWGRGSEAPRGGGVETASWDRSPALRSGANRPSQHRGGPVVPNPADTQEAGHAARAGALRHLRLRDGSHFSADATARTCVRDARLSAVETHPDGAPVRATALSSWVTPGGLLSLSQPRSRPKRGRPQHPPRRVVWGAGARPARCRACPGSPPCPAPGASASPTRRRERRVPEARANAPAAWPA